MLDTYEGTVLRGKGDTTPEKVWERNFHELVLQVAPREASKMAWADVLLGVQTILQNRYIHYTLMAFEISNGKLVAI